MFGPGVDQIEPSRRLTPAGRRGVGRVPTAALALVVSLGAGGCGPTSNLAAAGVPDAAPSPHASAGKPHKTTGNAANVVGLGDSVPAGGGGCDCTNFVQAYAQLIEANTGKPSAVENFAVGGTTSGDVVDELSQPAVIAALKMATIVLIMTGANDYDDVFDEAGIGIDPADIYPPIATVVQDNVTTTITKIKALNKKAKVVVLDYWAAEEDGAVARSQYDVTTQAAAIAATVSVNTALAIAAKAAGATYVSTYTAFKGKEGTQDDTNLLLADGDHPDPAGHALIAGTLAAVLPDGR
jgi:lysophospholipase L1-like esterase